MHDRAAVFSSQPQAIEILRAGAWWSGELLGWRHDGSGACQMWVRAVVGGVEETVWTGLADLRLPERRAAAAGPRGGQDEPPRQSASAPPGVPVTAEVTASLPLARNHVDADLARSGGRGPAVRAADVGVVPASAVPVPPGRHRARSVDPVAGRHRAADTGLTAVTAEPARQVSEEFPATVSCPVPAVRPTPTSEPAASASASASASDPEADGLLTRPMPWPTSFRTSAARG